MTAKVSSNFIRLGELSATPVDPPPAGHWFLYFLSDGLYVMDDAGVETGPLGTGGGGGAVDSVFGRTGDVVAVANDYHASEIEVTPAGNIASTNVQTALEELDSEKSETGHNHTGTYQPLDSDLTAIAGLSPADDDIIQRKSGAWTSRTLSQLATDLTELIQDIVGAMVSGNTETNITVTYDDTSGKIDFVVSGGGGAFWTAVPGSPTRTGNTTFTLTDTGNANLYDKLISKGTCLKWTESSVVKQAMVISATYATNTVTVTIIGDTMASIDSNSLKYGAEKARIMSWAYFGTVGATGTDVAGARFAPMDMKVFGADIRLGTAGSGTTTVDINDDGTTMFTTKPSITTTNTADLDNTADNTIIAAEDSKLTIDFDAVAGTPGVDMYIDLFWTPDLNRYLT